MESAIVYLVGPPGVGKYTIGREVARRTGARLVDNHSVANVLFNLIAPDGVTPLPPEIWPRVLQVRAVVLDTLANVAPRGLSFVFTNFLHGDDPAEEAAFEELRAIARLRGDTFVPVILRCDIDELLRRIVSEDRRERMKLVDPAMGKDLAGKTPFRTSHANALYLDVTSLPVEESADRIVQWSKQVTSNGGG